MAEQTFLIHTDAEGNLQFLYDDALKFLEQHGDVQIIRASDVDPDAQGNWWADLSKSGVDVKLGPFVTRREALQAERNYLDKEVLP